ncbi:MAG: hypothetical protein AAF721_00130 [Myxococcota bacterium]
MAAVASLLTGGCIVTKDMAQDGGSEDDGSGESAAAGSTSGGGTTGASASASGQGPTSEDEGDTSASSITVSTGNFDDGGTASDSATSAVSITASEGGTEGDEQALCEATGGTWDPTACGHYECGLPNECAAVIPGCDCGSGATFFEGGCVDDDACVEQLFACGEELDCIIGNNYCEEFVPGVKGAPITYTCQDFPPACGADPSCECLAEEGIIPKLAGDCSGTPATGVSVTLFGA